MPAAFEFVEVTPIIDRFDFDDSETLTVADMDRIAVEFGGHNALFDLNFDDVVDRQDVDLWLHDAAIINGFAEPYPSGDATLDGNVDAADLNAMAVNWQSNSKRWSGGDFNLDGVTDAEDLNLLALSWQESIPIAGELVAATVPEPAPMILFLVAVFAMVVRRDAGGCDNPSRAVSWLFRRKNCLP